MNTAQYITVRETAQLLSISEKKVMDLIEQRELQAYRIANKFLRLKKSEVLSIRNTGQLDQEDVNIEYTLGERVKDFFYFNDFYLISTGIILWLLYIILFSA